MAQDIKFDIIARDKASSTFSKVARSSDKTESTLKKFGKTALALGAVGSVGAAGAGLIRFLKDSNAEGREAQKVGALTAQAIKSTGGAARVTAGHVSAYAGALSVKVGIDDEAIQSGSNMLLTFTKIRNEVGKGNAIFDRATKAAVNLSARGFGSITGTSKTLGKALQDPIKGITALSRAGVTFTQQQKDQIKTLVESGRTLEAQKMILKEIETQVGGSAAAQATAGDKAAVSMANLKEQIGTALLPTVDKLAKLTTTKVIPAISEFVEGMQDGTGAGGDVADALKDLADVGKGLVQMFDSLPGPVKKFGVEIALGALAVSKLSTAIGSAELPGFASKLRNVETRAATLKTGLGTLAGGAGMLAVVDGARQSNAAVGALETTLGAAAVGFSLGGPVGAGVGALSGLMFSLAKNTKNTATEARLSIGSWEAYTATLDNVRGATTKLTKEQAIQRLSQKFGKGKNAVSGFDITRELGFNDRRATAALLHDGAAREKLIGVIKRERQALINKYMAMGKELGWSDKRTIAYGKEMKSRANNYYDLLKEIGAVGQAQAARRHEIHLLNDYDKALRGLPPRVITQVKAMNTLPTMQNIVALTRKYDLTPSKVETLLRATGVKPTQEQIQRITDKANALDRLRPKPTVDVNTAPADNALNALFDRLADFGAKLIQLSNKPVGGKAGGTGRRGGPNTRALAGGGSGSGSRTSGRGSSRTTGGPGGGPGGALNGPSGATAAAIAGQTVGKSYGNGVLAGITGTNMSVSKAMDRLGNVSGRIKAQLANLRTIRAGFRDTFKADSIFGMDPAEATSGGVAGLIAFQNKQATQAAQLNSDVKTVAGMGLSKSLISQLQAQGTSGAAILHELAQGNSSQIAQLNASNAATESSLVSAGMFAGNTVRGGSIDADISKAQRDKDLIERLIKSLDNRDDKTVIYIDSEAVIHAVKRRNRRKGVRTAGM